MAHERLGRSRFRVLTAIAIAFDVGALLIAATRNERAHGGRQHAAWPTRLATAPDYSMLVLHPSKSVERAMPCFQPPDADSSAYAALPAPVAWECDVASAKPSATPSGATRVYGLW